MALPELPVLDLSCQTQVMACLPHAIFPWGGQFILSDISKWPFRVVCGLPVTTKGLHPARMHSSFNMSAEKRVLHVPYSL